MELCVTAPELSKLGFLAVEIAGQKKRDEPIRIVQLDDVEGRLYE